MPTLINYGSELIRINPSNNRIEYSTNRGASWITRYSGSNSGLFRDLLQYGNEILACTDKGLYYSTNKGASWICRRQGPLLFDQQGGFLDMQEFRQRREDTHLHPGRRPRTARQLR